MKVPQRVSARLASRSKPIELGAPLPKHENKPDTIEEVPIPAKFRFSSIRLNYFSPLGNVAAPKEGKKDNKSPSKQQQQQEHVSPLGNVAASKKGKKDNKSTSIQEHEHPGSPVEIDKKASNETRRRRKRRKISKLLNSDMNTKGDNTTFCTDSPSNGHSVRRDRPSNVAVQSSKKKQGNQDESKKRKNRANGPSSDDIVEITSVVSRTNPKEGKNDNKVPSIQEQEHVSPLVQSYKAIAKRWDQPPQAAPGTRWDQPPQAVPGTRWAPPPQAVPGTKWDQPPQAVPGTRWDQPPQAVPGTRWDQPPQAVPGPADLPSIIERAIDRLKGDNTTSCVMQPSLTTETDELDNPSINKVGLPGAKNQKNSSDAHETILITDSPSNSQSVRRDRPGNVALQCSTKKQGNQDESKKRKHRDNGPSSDDIVEITSVASRTNLKEGKNDNKASSIQEHVSPLGNVAAPLEGKKGNKSHSPSIQEQEHAGSLVEIANKASKQTIYRRMRRKISQMSVLGKEVLSQMLDEARSAQVAVAPDMPTPDDNSDMNTKGDNTTSCVMQPSSTTETDGLDNPPINKVGLPGAKNQKNSSEAHETILITDSPSNGHSVRRDRPGNVAVQCYKKKQGNQDESKKRKNRGNGPSSDDIVEITSVASPNDRDVVVIAPPEKRRKISLEGNTSLSVTIRNVKPHNETIDVEDDDTVTVVSDEEDIIVLGSPAVPSVRSYKAIATRWGTPPQTAPAPADLPSIIERAIDRLKQTTARPAMLGGGSNSHQASRKVGGGSGYSHPSLPSTSARQPNPVIASPANIYGGNLYNPAGAKTPPTKGLRPVIIDASNVAMGHGNSKVFSCRGIEICVNYFLKRKHKVFAFLPKYRRSHMQTKDAHLLDKMEANNNLIFTPSRYIDGQREVPYDDRFIVQTAAELGGVIVSTDNYRDLMRENPAWHDTIKNRLLMFTWVEDLLIFPQDPQGRRGVGLEDFLRF